MQVDCAPYDGLIGINELTTLSGAQREPMPKYRSHSIQFRGQVAQEYLPGETLHGLAKRTMLPEPDPTMSTQVCEKRIRRRRSGRRSDHAI